LSKEISAPIESRLLCQEFIMRKTRVRGFVVASIAVVSCLALPYNASAADRFEVASLKGVRPTLVRTVDALQKGNL
jgi:hypothetical protein